jgi:hypothetical protein
MVKRVRNSSQNKLILVEVDDEEDPVHELGSIVSDLELVRSNPLDRLDSAQLCVVTPGSQTLEFSWTFCVKTPFFQLCSQFSARSIDRDSLV